MLQRFLKNTGHSRRNQDSPSDYHVFGTYACGNHYGTTAALVGHDACLSCVDVRTRFTSIFPTTFTGPPLP